MATRIVRCLYSVLGLCRRTEGPLLSGVGCEQALPGRSPSLCDGAHTPMHSTPMHVPQQAQLPQRLPAVRPRGQAGGRLLRRFFSPASPALLGGKIHAHTVFFFFNLKADPLLVMITCIFPKEKKNVFSGTVSNVKEASDFLARRGLLAAGWAGVPTPWCCSGFSPLNALRPCPWRRPHAGRTGARRLKVDALSFSKGALRNPRFSTLLEKNRILRLHFRRQNSNFCTVVT